MGVVWFFHVMGAEVWTIGRARPKAVLWVGVGAGGHPLWGLGVLPTEIFEILPCRRYFYAFPTKETDFSRTVQLNGELQCCRAETTVVQLLH